MINHQELTRHLYLTLGELLPRYHHNTDHMTKNSSLDDFQLPLKSKDKSIDKPKDQVIQ